MCIVILTYTLQTDVALGNLILLKLYSALKDECNIYNI